MKKVSKKILLAIIIIGFVIFSYFWLQYGPDLIRDNYDPYNPTQQVVGVLVIVGIGIFFRKVKNIPKYKQQANLWQWFMIALIPTPIVFAAVIQSGISYYWGLFAFVLASTIWISIGVYNGTHHEKKWDSDYKFNFGIGIFMLLSIGIMIHTLFTIIAKFAPEKLLP